MERLEMKKKGFWRHLYKKKTKYLEKSKIGAFGIIS